METHSIPDFTIIQAVGAVFIAFLYITLSSIIKEPQRQQFSAIMIGGAGAAYLSGGLGAYEFVFCAMMTFIAFKGLKNYYFVGIGWLLHTFWDILHHFYGNPIVSFSPSSSAGCAVCDTVLAIWFFMNAPSVFDVFLVKKMNHSK